MAGRTVLVTGARGGIGRAAALGPARMRCGPGDLRPGPREHRGRSRWAQRRRRRPVEVSVADLSAKLEVRRGSTRRVRGRPGPARWSSWWLLASRGSGGRTHRSRTRR